MSADIRTLAVERGRIMALPEYVQKIIITHDAGVKDNLDNLGMLGLAGADILIVGIDGNPALITNNLSFSLPLNIDRLWCIFCAFPPEYNNPQENLITNVRPVK